MKSKFYNGKNLLDSLIHTLHSFFSFPAVLAFRLELPRELGGTSFSSKLFSWNGSKKYLAFSWAETLNFTMHSNHQDPFLKSFRSCDSSHVGRHSEIYIKNFFFSLKLLIPNSGLKSQFILNFIYLFWLPCTARGILASPPGIEPEAPCNGNVES